MAPWTTYARRCPDPGVVGEREVVAVAGDLGVRDGGGLHGLDGLRPHPREMGPMTVASIMDTVAITAAAGLHGEPRPRSHIDILRFIYGHPFFHL